MNILKYALIFIAGAGVGTGVSALFLKKKYEKIYQEKADMELAEMDKYYQEKLKYQDEVAEYYPKDYTEVKEEPTKKPEKRKGSFATDYTAYYEESNELTDPAEEEHPEEDEKVIREKRHPRIISERDFGMDGYSTRVLYYYTMDDALIPEGGSIDEILDTAEVADSIGNALIKYGFADENNLDREVFVRNFDRKTDYQIVKVNGSVSEDYGG